MRTFLHTDDSVEWLGLFADRGHFQRQRRGVEVGAFSSRCRRQKNRRKQRRKQRQNGGRCGKAPYCPTNLKVAPACLNMYCWRHLVADTTRVAVLLIVEGDLQRGSNRVQKESRTVDYKHHPTPRTNTHVAMHEWCHHHHAPQQACILKHARWVTAVREVVVAWLRY